MKTTGKSMKTNAIVLAVGLAASNSATMGAQVVFSNPTDPVTITNLWSSCRGSDFSGYRVFDGFQLGSWSRITRLSWVGVYHDYLQPTNDPVEFIPTTNWQITFYADNAGAPGAILLNSQLPAESVTSTVLSNAWVSDTNKLLLRSFTAQLPTPFYLPAHVPYWCSVLSQQPLFNPLFAWWSGGPGDCVQMTLSDSTLATRPRNRAFTLEGAALSADHSIHCGQTVVGSIASPAQTDTYTFSATAGEVAIILAEGQPGTPKWFNAKAEVYSPDGVPIGGVTNTGLRLWLTNSGIFTILVHDDDYAQIGQYGLSLSFATGRCGEELVWGLSSAGPLVVQGEAIPYTFNGCAGEIWNLSVYGEPGTPKWFNALANVYDPTGSRLGYCINGAITVTVTNTGIHTVLVSADDLNHIGTYSVSIQLVHPVAGSYRLGIASTNGAAGLKLWGQLGGTTTLQFATNLLGTNPWRPLTNFSLPWSPYCFVDWSSTNWPQRYYRFFQSQAP